jgi:PAS domain S-box-containing protein
MPFATAAHRHEPLIVADLAADLGWPEFRESALAAGIRACWSQPILGQDGETLGTLDMYHREPKTPSEYELSVMDALCPIARIAIEHDRRGQDLQQADERLTSLAQNLPGVVYQRVVDPDGEIRYTYISEGARDLFGVSPEQVIADPQAVFDRHGPEYRATFRENLLQASRDLTMWDVEAPIITQDGEHKWGHAIARPVRQPDGSVIWNGIILDATRIKNANIELAASNKAKDEFLANMSHELRTPLNAIIGFADVIRGEMMGEIGVSLYKDYAEDIHASGRHLLQVISDILDIAKIEAGTLSLNECVVDPVEALKGCVRLITERTDNQNISVSIEAEEGLPHLRADSRKLKQILINLLSNAVKFSPGDGAVVARVEISEEGGMSFSISDNGIGIPAEMLSKIFEPFSQVDTGLDRKFEGTGLGLPLTHAMVQLHDGNIEIESEPGVGTTATVLFPKHRIVEPTVE